MFLLRCYSAHQTFLISPLDIVWSGKLVSFIYFSYFVRILQKLSKICINLSEWIIFHSAYLIFIHYYCEKNWIKNGVEIGGNCEIIGKLPNKLKMFTKFFLIWKQVASCLQQLMFLNGHQSKYRIISLLLNFVDWAWVGVFSVIWL